MKVAGQRTLYLSVHDDAQPSEIFLRVKGSDRSSELIGLYDVIVRLMSLALQYGAPLERVGDLLAGAKFEPCDPVSGHNRLKHYTSLSDLIGQHLLVEYCDREELAHAPLSPVERASEMIVPTHILCGVERSIMTSIKQQKRSQDSQSTVNAMLAQLRRSPTWKRRRQAAREVFRR